MTRTPTNPGLVLLAAAARSAGFGDGVYEYRFAYPRRFKFDLAYPVYMVAFEREGLGKGGGTGRHQRLTGFTSDIEKYNLATIAGWAVIRGTPKMIQDGSALGFLLDALRTRKVK